MAFLCACKFTINFMIVVPFRNYTVRQKENSSDNLPSYLQTTISAQMLSTE